MAVSLMRRCVGAVLLAALTACATPVRQNAMSAATYPPVKPVLLDAENAVIVEDGARLGLTVWPAEGVLEPDHVIVGIHGMNNYAGEFRLAAPEWARDGIAVYAYDQRGFGRSLERGIWPEEDLMRTDLRMVTSLVRNRHPTAKVTVVAISMGAAVAITAFASGDPPEADRLILSGPGLRGWGAMSPWMACSLWLGARTAPGAIVRTPPLARPKLTDNDAFLEVQEADPLHMHENRIDQLSGVVSLMEHAHRDAPKLPAGLPVLISYGARDEVIPEAGPRRTIKRLPPHVRTVYYEAGYHVLLSDLQRGNVIADYAAFMRDPASPLPSGAPEWPFR